MYYVAFSEDNRRWYSGPFSYEDAQDVRAFWDCLDKKRLSGVISKPPKNGIHLPNVTGDTARWNLGQKGITTPPSRGGGTRPCTQGASSFRGMGEVDVTHYGNTGYTKDQVWAFYVRALHANDVSAMDSWHREYVAKGGSRGKADTAMATGGRLFQASGSLVDAFQKTASGLSGGGFAGLGAASTKKSIAGLRIDGTRWRDSFGNTYHRAYIYVGGRQVGVTPVTYGYDRQYLETAKKWLLKNGYRDPGNVYRGREGETHDVNRKRDL